MEEYYEEFSAEYRGDNRPPSICKDKISGEIWRAKCYIDCSYAHRLTLSDLSRHVYLSPAYLCTVFKRDMKMGFIQYLTVVRIESAKRLLRSTRYPMRKIAELVGYSDVAYFRSLFCRYNGMLPSTYRATMRTEAPGKRKQR